MDRETLLEHRALWVPESGRQPEAPVRLTPSEQELFTELVANTHGDRVRLEQERIRFGWVERALDRVTSEP